MEVSKPQTNIGPKKNLGPKKKLGPEKKIMGPKKFWYTKNFWFENFWVKRNCGSKKMLAKILGQKFFFKTILGPKKFLDLKKCPKIFWVWKFFWVQ